MKFYSLTSALTLFLSACTFTPQGNDMETEFHPPLVYQHWHVKHYTLQNGAKACAISSGYNGLTVLLSHRTEGEGVSVQSNRLMAPGATLTVNIDGSSFETSNTFFSPKSARALVENLAKGGKAYLEWSEFSGPTESRVHIQNVLWLDDFEAQLIECRNSPDLKH